jgi:hypothetical protein
MLLHYNNKVFQSLADFWRKLRMFAAILNIKYHYTLHEICCILLFLLNIRWKGVIDTAYMDMQASDTSILILMCCDKNQENLLQTLCSDICLDIKFVIEQSNEMCSIYQE